MTCAWDQDEPSSADFATAHMDDVRRMTDGAVGTLGNLAFHADRVHSVPEGFPEAKAEAPFARGAPRPCAGAQPAQYARASPPLLALPLTPVALAA
jgi:hypothetical protein